MLHTIAIIHLKSEVHGLTNLKIGNTLSRRDQRSCCGVFANVVALV